MKCDAVRTKIEEWKIKKMINSEEYFFLLASLIETIDKYANTAVVYGAFLKDLKEGLENRSL
jgi:adenine-specific DNA-methyltransferase